MKWSQQSLFTKLCCGEPGSQIFPFNLFLFFWCTGGWTQGLRRLLAGSI
jgi:hypothetical protein